MSDEQKDRTAEEVIEDLFTYHAPQGDQPERYRAIREAAKALALTIHKACPESPDRTAAMRKLRETVMTANASIATRGGFYR